MKTIDNWLEARKRELTGTDEAEVVKTIRKVTVRLEQSEIDQLDYIAEKTGMSRAGALESLSKAVILDTYEAILTEPFFANSEIVRVGIDSNSMDDLEQLSLDGELTNESLSRVLSSARLVDTRSGGLA